MEGLFNIFYDDEQPYLYDIRHPTKIMPLFIGTEVKQLLTIDNNWMSSRATITYTKTDHLTTSTYIHSLDWAHTTPDHKHLAK
eukprot:3596852-Heterocapsa_arctica.AAC.1